MLLIMVSILAIRMGKLLWLMRNLDAKISNMLENICVNFGIVILSMGDQLLLLMLMSITILHFQMLKKKHGIGLIAIHRFVNIPLIYTNVKIEIAAIHHELLMSLNFYH